MAEGETYSRQAGNPNLEAAARQAISVLETARSLENLPPYVLAKLQRAARANTQLLQDSYRESQ